MIERPEPLTSLDMRHVPAMLLDVSRFRDSDLAGEDPAIIGLNLMLWACSWHQIPCSSIPNDDRVLARYAGYGRDVDGWLAVRDRVLSHGWVLCSDNRLYHRVVAEKAIETAETGKVRSKKAKHAAAQRWAKHPTSNAPSNAPSISVASNGHDSSSAQPVLGDAKVKESKVNKKEHCRVKSDPTAAEEDFEKFWKAYPRSPNMSKKEARTAWEKLTGADKDAVLATAPKYHKWFTDEQRKRPDATALHAVRFITQRRFEGFLEPPDPAKVDQPAMKHGDVAPASAGRLAGYIWLKSETEDWDNWREYQRKNGLKTSPTDRFGGWLFPTRSPPT